LTFTDTARKIIEKSAQGLGRDDPTLASALSQGPGVLPAPMPLWEAGRSPENEFWLYLTFGPLAGMRRIPFPSGQLEAGLPTLDCGHQVPWFINVTIPAGVAPSGLAMVHVPSPPETECYYVRGIMVRVSGGAGAGAISANLQAYFRAYGPWATGAGFQFQNVAPPAFRVEQYIGFAGGLALFEPLGPIIMRPGSFAENWGGGLVSRNPELVLELTQASATRIAIFDVYFNIIRFAVGTVPLPP
jgi:hypothetical protein